MHIYSVPPKLSEVIKGIVSVPDVSLLNIEGSALAGVPGISERLFSCLRRVKVSVILIAQASSEHSICLAIKSSDLQASVDAVGTGACENFFFFFFFKFDFFFLIFFFHLYLSGTCTNLKVALC
jgi:hypothetical protein